MRTHCPCLAIKQSIYLLAIVPKGVASSVLKIDVCGAIGSKTLRPDYMREGRMNGAREPRHPRNTVCFFDYALRQQLYVRESLCQIGQDGDIFREHHAIYGKCRDF